MKEVFMIAWVGESLGLVLFPEEYATYGEAMAAIELQPIGTYQVQKFFKVG